MLVIRSAVRVSCLLVLLVIGAAGSGALIAQPAGSAKASSDASLLAELAFWESVQDSENPDELRAYLDAYPEGRFAALARLRIKALMGEGAGRKDSEVAESPRPSQTAPVAPVRDQSAPPPQVGGDLKPGDTFRDCDICPSMVVVPGGRFAMGNDPAAAKTSPRAVTIPRAFAIGIYEVTVDEWDACLRESRCGQSTEQGQEKKLPASNVSWDDAQDYVKWLSEKTGRKYRLPTEAEWEYAARAGTTTRYWWGNEPGVKRANCADCGSPWDGKGKSPVGSFKANPFGLYDVHGNVWEWTDDCWNPTYRGAPDDGRPWLRGDCLSRVLRGGAWALDHEYMTSARRSRYDRDVRYRLHGFRVVGEVAEPTSEVSLFEAAVLEAVDKVFSSAPKPASRSVSESLVIDPLIDGLSGAQSVATRIINSRIVERVRTKYRRFDVNDFTASGVAKSPYAVIGTFTGVNKQRQTTGVRVAFRIWLTLLDIETGRVASKAKVFSQAAGVDITPTAFFRDSPVWMADPSAQAYIKSCQATKPGGPIDPHYLERVKTAALIQEAIDAYEKGQFRTSRDLFQSASQVKGGDQLRTYNGLYLTSWRLGERIRAAQAFGKLVDYGLNHRRFAVKFRFSPGSTDLVTAPNGAEQYDMWLQRIAKGTARRQACLEIVGHTARVRPEPLNQRLSIRRAEYIRQRLEAEVPELDTRIIAAGSGSQDNLIGSATGDAKDALDERIGFEAIACSPSG
jgi:formylglycine-generating enzyme required for sulfatase activity